MFDLFRSRDKAVRILLGGILVVVSLSMLTYLIPNYGSGSDPSDQIVAEVGKEVISLQLVSQRIQQAMRGRQIPPALVPTMIPRMIDDMVMSRAMAYEASRLGFKVSDEEMSNAIRAYIPSLFPDGKFLGKEAYAALLAQQNTTIEIFETELRDELLAARMRDVALEGVIVTQPEIEQEYRRKKEQIKVEYVKLTADRYKAESQPSLEEMQTYYKANVSAYTTPEKRNLVILLAEQAKLQQGLNPDDAELLRLYNQNQESFRTPERVRVRHILLKTTEKPASEEPKIKAQAEDLLKKIKAGANFAELAKKHSEDTTSANNEKSPGELPQWITRGQTVPEFEKVAFTLKPGETSDLVKTQYGYHIIQVLEHQDARLRPFAEVKSELADEWKKQRTNDLLQDISDRAQTALQKDPQHPEAVAAAFHMQLIKADGVASGEPVPEIGTNADFDQSIAGLKAGEVSQPVALPGDKIALALITGVTPARPSTFEEVQSKLRDKIVENRSNAAVAKHAQELTDAAKKAGSLAAAAKAMGLSVTPTDWFDRNGSIPGLGLGAYMQDGFGKPDGTVLGPIGMADATVVAQVKEHKEADMAGLAAERSAIRDELKKQKAQIRESLFREGLREMLVKQKKIKVHEAVITRLINSYASSS